MMVKYKKKINVEVVISEIRVSTRISDMLLIHEQIFEVGSEYFIFINIFNF